jgi:DNA polymerase III epsilon subunit-like protein
MEKGNASMQKPNNYKPMENSGQMGYEIPEEYDVPEDQHSMIWQNTVAGKKTNQIGTRNIAQISASAMPKPDSYADVAKSAVDNINSASAFYSDRAGIKKKHEEWLQKVQEHGSYNVTPGENPKRNYRVETNNNFERLTKQHNNTVQAMMEMIAKRAAKQTVSNFEDLKQEVKNQFGVTVDTSITMQVEVVKTKPSIIVPQASETVLTVTKQNTTETQQQNTVPQLAVKPNGAATPVTASTTEPNIQTTLKSVIVDNSKNNDGYVTFEEMPTNIRHDLTNTVYKKKVYAIDTESVGGDRKSLVGQVAVVDQFGQIVYDTYVQPNGEVLDYRTRWSGLTANKLRGAPPLCQVQRELRTLFKDAILIGHSIATDLRGLGISVHPHFDTQNIPEYYRIGNHVPALRTLASRYYGINIQSHSHSPVEDAIITMALFKRAYKVIPQYNNRSFDVMAGCNCGDCSARKIREGRRVITNSVFFLRILHEAKLDRITNNDTPTDDFDMRLFSSLIANDKVKFKKYYGVDEEQYQLLVQWWSAIKTKFKKK